MDRYLSGAHAAPIVSADERPSEYPGYAAAALAGAPPCSLVQGEHPKR